MFIDTFTSLSRNMFRPHGPSSGDHKEIFSTYLQEDFFLQRICCLMLTLAYFGVTLCFKHNLLNRMLALQ
jgi:hypothetical protein